jgi:DNA-binding NarL/FixJ family response regulator
VQIIAEYEVLVDIALGLTDNMIADRRYLTRRGVQSRLKVLYQKLGADRASAKDDLGDTYNSRSRAISIALTRGLLNAFELKEAEKAWQRWLKNKH